MSITHVPDPSDATSALDVRRENPWAELEGAFDDGSNLFAEHFGLSLPRLRSDFGRNGKGWVDDLTGEVCNELVLVLLALPPSRQFWLKSIDEGGGGPPDCKSFDLVRPDATSLEPQATLCAECPHSKWSTTEDGKRVRPPCGESINVVAYNVGEGVYTWLRFSGTAIKPFKAYYSGLRARRIPHFAVATHVTLDSVKQPGMEWLVPIFSIGEHLTPDQVAPMRDVAKKAMESFGQVFDEMNEAEARAAGPFDGPDKSHEPFPDEDVTDAEIVDEPVGGRPIHKNDVAGRFGASEEEF